MSELVERTGVPAATIRYYLSVGLLPLPVKAATNRFLYDERHVELVRLVRLLRERRQLGLEAIAALLPDLLPDLLGRPETLGTFRPEMWGRLLRAPLEPTSTEVVRARVLHAAVAAFARHGYSEVTVDDVCRAAGIAKGSFYRYFAAKEDLFFAAARAAGSAVAARLAAAATGGGAGGWDEAVLAEAVRPELGILLDLSALAARRREGAAPTLADVLASLEDALGAALDPGDAAHAAHALALALGAGLRLLVVAPEPVRAALEHS
jgi:AcrR family transcriptional regulator